ncbi:ATP-dependent DNA/RNA helicase DHX36-like isoform X2 [Euwallacea fornicatus]|uniref:ATP-dependent DNA/RNA helicase DHX36-like isoform X2 n=1 Tax=Euwallacea fornicatus TaxID=995702 RepID=UPI00338FD92C
MHLFSLSKALLYSSLALSPNSNFQLNCKCTLKFNIATMTGRRKNWRYKPSIDRGEPRQHSNDRGEPRRHDQRPKGLKGREIGLWYANKAKQKRDMLLEAGGEGASSVIAREEFKRQRTLENQERANSKPLGSILVSSSKKDNIEKLLNETSLLYPSKFSEKTTSYEHLEETDFKHEFLTHITGNIIEKLKSTRGAKYQYNNDYENASLLEELQRKIQSRTYQEMQKVRNKLPSMGMKDQVIDLIEKNQIAVISGETGCGKTTQVAQFILDDYIKKGKGSQCKIVCTQPRRISAISVAERVAAERDEKLGCSVGFQIRLEKVMPRDRGSILFCTTGVLLKFMESDPALTHVSHLILDEIHERDVTCDFLITVLKDVIQYRSDIKIILMSATLNSEAFSKYYDNAPHINIPGFTYPVTEFYLEDVLQMTGYKFKEEPRKWVVAKNRRKHREWSEYIEPYIRQLEMEQKYDRNVIQELRKMKSESLDIPLIYELLVYICEKADDNGTILIFVPGFADISKFCTMLRDSGRFDQFKYIIIPLHSQLPTVDQKQIFKPAPKDMRKIIISTNIAETSITIDDVTTVIDCGYIKISNLDAETGIETLDVELVSQANASQRKGRAGRVKPGICYHLISNIRYQLLDKFLKPEVLRKRLEDVILQLKMLQLGEAEPFLGKLMDPPETKSVQTSLTLLQRLGALDSEENLTPLGFHMAKLPIPAQCSKMLILAAMFSCVDPVLSVAASLGYKDAYQLSMSNDNKSNNADKMKYELSRGTNSDHICMHYAIRGYEETHNPYSFCRKYFLSSSTLKLLKDMRKQFAEHLSEMKFISSSNPRNPGHNHNSNNVGLIKAIIAAGLYPNIAIITKVRKGGAQLRTVNHERMEFHPKSVLQQTRSFPSPLIAYHLRLKSSKIYVHDGTVVFPLSLVFFGDQFKIHNEENGQNGFNGVSVNENMKFLCSQSTSFAVQKLRDRLTQILEWKIAHPGPVDWSQDSPEVKILKAIMDMIATEDGENLDLSDYDDM